MIGLVCQARLREEARELKEQLAAGSAPNGEVDSNGPEHDLESYILALDRVDEHLAGEWRVLCSFADGKSLSYTIEILDVRPNPEDKHVFFWKGKSAHGCLEIEGKESSSAPGELPEAKWTEMGMFDDGYVELEFTEVSII